LSITCPNLGLLKYITFSAVSVKKFYENKKFAFDIGRGEYMHIMEKYVPSLPHGGRGVSADAIWMIYMKKQKDKKGSKMRQKRTKF
jgi:hypothetical protein